jgi:hypothetical protein
MERLVEQPHPNDGDMTWCDGSDCVVDLAGGLTRNVQDLFVSSSLPTNTAMLTSPLMWMWSRLMVTWTRFGAGGFPRPSF